LSGVGQVLAPPITWREEPAMIAILSCYPLIEEKITTYGVMTPAVS
jgi:hypothetical protein